MSTFVSSSQTWSSAGTVTVAIVLAVLGLVLLFAAPAMAAGTVGLDEQALRAPVTRASAAW